MSALDSGRGLGPVQLLCQPRPKHATHIADTYQSISHNVYYVKRMLAALGYYAGILRLLLERLLPPSKLPKDRGAIDACQAL